METHFRNLEDAQDARSRRARERVAADLKSLVRDSEDLLKATADDMSEKAKAARARMATALERTRDTCGDLQEQTAATARAAVRKADTVVRDYPYQSLGIGFALGLLIGVLVARK